MELETLVAIFPEIQRPDQKPPFTFRLELPVEPGKPVTVTFPALSSTLPLTTAVDAAQGGLGASTSNQDGPSVVVRVAEDSCQVTYLPPLDLRMSLPDGYPAHLPPLVSISTSPQWLSPSVIRKLEEDGPRLWEECGRDSTAYAYIDHLQHAAEDVFGSITAEGCLTVASEHKLAVLDYDIKAKRVAFENETFECGVCLGE